MWRNTDYCKSTFKKSNRKAYLENIFSLLQVSDIYPLTIYVSHIVVWTANADTYYGKEKKTILKSMQNGIRRRNTINNLFNCLVNSTGITHSPKIITYIGFSLINQKSIFFWMCSMFSYTLHNYFYWYLRKRGRPEKYTVPCWP